MAQRDEIDIELELFEAEAQRAQEAEGGTTIDADQPRKRRRLPWPAWLLILPLLAVLIYYLAGMALTYRINDNLDFRGEAAVPGGSEAVAMAISLLDREINRTDWPANDPWFLPGSLLDNMPNFQRGVVYSVRIFTDQMRLSLGRNRGSSVEDPALASAWSLLSISPNRWTFDFSRGIMPQPSAEDEYGRAIEELRRYNQRLASGEANFDVRPDNLIDMLRQVRNDLGAASAAAQEVIARERTDPVVNGRHDRPATDFEIYYRNKGMVYGYYRLLDALGEDFAEVIEQRAVTTLWTNMMTELRIAAGLQPFMTFNAPPDAQFMPNHLAGQGFYILRARVQLAEIMDVLEN